MKRWLKQRRWAPGMGMLALAGVGFLWAGGSFGQEAAPPEASGQRAAEATSALGAAPEAMSPWSATSVPVEDLAPAGPAQRPEQPLSLRPPKLKAAPKPSPTARHSEHAKQWAPVLVPGDGTQNVGGKASGEAERLPQDTRHALAPASPGSSPTGQTARGTAPGGAPQSVPAPDATRKPEVAPADKPAQQYCINISSAAADARFAWEKKSMEEIARDLDDRMAKLEEKTKEYKKWKEERDNFSNYVETDLVNIYTKMKPDAAAAQLADMEEKVAAALLLKIKPANASAILNEINPAKGARLAMILELIARKDVQFSGEAKPSEPAETTPTPPSEKKL